MYRSGLESILGIERHGESLSVNPCIPFSWPEFSVVLRCGASRYEITVENPLRRCRGIAETQLDGVAVDPRAIPLRDDGRTHVVRAVIGDPVKAQGAAGRVGARRK
jgi:cyclic beta-1,2-glucan synthetase